MPSVVTFGNGNTITYLYAADGRKLRTVHVIGGTATTTDYCGNVIYENGTARLLLTEAGYIDLSDNSYHYYIKDHLGNNRVVADANGTVEESNQYYPFGLTYANANSNLQPYKYNGKELDTKNGLNWYDYGARHYDAVLGRFTTQDRFAEKYTSLSPYQYAANSPVCNVDINGDSIVVLTIGIEQHLGLLIQNKNNEWQYFSFNGANIYDSTNGIIGGGPKDNLGEMNWKSPQDFINSEYNQKTSDNNALETEKNNGYGYKEGYVIPTTKEQDETIRKTFTEVVNEGYSLIDNHCSIAVQKSLNAAGIDTHFDNFVPTLGTGNIINFKNNPYFPSKAYQAIKKRNPQGFIIKSNK